MYAIILYKMRKNKNKNTSKKYAVLLLSYLYYVYDAKINFRLLH